MLVYQDRIAQVSMALADPTRRQIMELLLATGTPLSVREVAERFGLHVNAARMHLDKLAKGGLLMVSRRRGERGGRPAYMYMVSGEEWELHLPPRSYKSLAVILVSGLRNCGEEVLASLVDDARAFGRSEALRASSPLAHLPREAEVEDVAEAWKEDLIRRGVSARHRRGDKGAIEVEFLACPFGGVVHLCRNLVCEIHRGLEEGLLGLVGEWRIERPGEGCVFLARKEETPRVKGSAATKRR